MNICRKIDRTAIEQAARQLAITAFQNSSDEDLLDDILNQNHAYDERFYVLKENGEFAGAIRYFRMTGDKELYITTLFVMPEERSKGIGTTLLEQVKKAAQALGYNRITLKPLMDSIPFYLKMGFEFTEDRACSLAI